jgi:hypothetical protein
VNKSLITLTEQQDWEDGIADFIAWLEEEFPNGTILV